MQFENLQCRNPLHSSQPILSLCTDPTCLQSRLCCMSCLIDSHKYHVDSMIKLSDIMSITAPITSLINWPKDPVIKSLSIYFQEVEKHEKSFYEDKTPILQDPFAIIENLLEELASAVNTRLAEIRFALKERMKVGDFTTPLNTQKLRQIYEDTYDLRPVRESLMNYLNHYMDYYKLEQDLKGFFTSSRYQEAGNFLKKQLQNSAYEISMENFQAFKEKLICFLSLPNFQTFLLSLRPGDFLNKQQEIAVEHDDSIYNNYYNNEDIDKKTMKNQSTHTSYSNSPSKINRNPIKPLIPTKNSKSFIGKRTFQSNVHSDWVYSVEFMKNTHFFASAGADRCIKLWDLPSRTGIKSLTGHKDTIKSLNYIENNRILISGSYDKTIKLWDPFNQYLFGEFKDKCSVNQVRYMGFARRIASGGDDNLIKVWDLDSGDCPVGVWQGHQNNIQALIDIEDHQLLASGSWDKQIKLWDFRKKEAFATLKGHEDWVNTLEYIPELSYLASGSRDGEVKMWDLRTMRCVAEEIGLKKSDNKGIQPIRSLCYMKGLSYLAMATGDKIKVKILNGDDAFVLEGHKDEVLDVKWVESSKELITCSKDKTIGIWS